MKTITASELHQHLYEYLVQAQEDEIIVTLDNGALVRLSAIEEDLIDDTLESDPRFIQLINERREHYQRSGGVSLEIVQAALIDELIRELEDTDPHVRSDPDYDLTVLENQLGDAAIGNSVGRRMINRITFLAFS